MGYRDKSQGFAFVYADLKKVMEKAVSSEDGAEKGDSASKVSFQTNQIINFNKDHLNQRRHAPKPMAAEPVRNRISSVAEIKSNLDRLQSLHHKLHTVLADLEKMTDKPKKK